MRRWCLGCFWGWSCGSFATRREGSPKGKGSCCRRKGHCDAVFSGEVFERDEARKREGKRVDVDRPGIGGVAASPLGGAADCGRLREAGRVSVAPWRGCC